jgi:formylglycine-generating enzyme required for sulfatase activity
LKSPQQLLWALCLVGFAASLQAAPETLSYASRITVDGQPYDGTGQFKFALVSPGAVATYWKNAGSGPGEPSAAVSLQVNAGVYAVRLGDLSIPNMAALSGSLFQTHGDIHLRVWFRAGSSGAFDLLSPDQPIGSVAYALSAARAQVADTVAPNAITSEMLSVDLRNLIESNATLGTGSVTLANLSPEVVAALQILPSISTQPFARFDHSTGKARVEVVGRGYNLSYQWLKDGQPINGATAPVLEIAGADTDDNATYTVRITNSLGEATSQAITLQNAEGAPGPPLQEANATEVPRNGLVLWLDANDLDADGLEDSISIGHRISRWQDKVTDKNATQSQWDQQPVKHSAGVSFDGGDVLSIMALNLTAQHIFIAGNRRPDTSNWSTLLSGEDQNNKVVLNNFDDNFYNVYSSHFTKGNGGSIRVSAGSNLIPLAMPFVSTFTVGAEGSDNGVFTDLHLGSDSAQPSWAVDGVIYEVLFYDRILQDAERDEVERYLADKWGATLYQDAIPPAEPETGLLAYYKFEPVSVEPNKVWDYSGNEFHLNMTGFSEDPWVDGVAGKALQFNGVTASAKYDVVLNESKTMSSVIFWAKTDVPVDGRNDPNHVFKVNDGGLQKSFFFNASHSAPLHFQLLNQSAGGWMGTEPGHSNQYAGWIHCSMVSTPSDGQYDLYLNGQKTTLIKSDAGSGVFRFRVWFHLGPSGSRYRGALDEFRIYDRILSEAEIQTLYNSVQTPLVRTTGEHNATVGSAFSLSLAADNAPTTYLAEGLPAGLSLNVSTGEITGAVSQPGYHRVFLKAMNEHGTGSTTIAIVARSPTDQHGWPVDVPDGSSIPQNGMVLWLDANDVDADGQFDSNVDHLKLANWADKAGQDNNATQDVVAHQPEVRTQQIASPALSLLVFDGNQSLSFPKINQGKTFFWVVNRGSPADVLPYFFGLSSTSHWGQHFHNMIFWGGSGPVTNGLQRRNGEEVSIGTIDNSFLFEPLIITLQPTEFQPADLIGKHGISELYFTGSLGEILVYDRALTDPEIDTVEQYLGSKWGIALAGASPEPDLTTGLVAHLPFDETSGLVANDVTGNNNHATLQGYEGNATWISGKIGGALDFDGSNDLGAMPRPADDVFTMSLWLRTTMTVATHYWYHWRPVLGGQIENYAFFIRDSRVVFRAGSNEHSNQLKTNSIVSTGNWVHFAATLDKATKTRRLFVNSSFDVEKTEWIDPAAPPQAIGTWQVGKMGNSGDPFRGSLDDLRVYDRILTDAEIKALYDLGFNPAATLTYASSTPSLNLNPSPGSVGATQLNETILKYLRPEITANPQGVATYTSQSANLSVAAEGKYLNYQWQRNGQELAGETNATLVITDANATTHDGNYTVVVSNEFGSAESLPANLLIEIPMKLIPGGTYSIGATTSSVGHEVVLSPYLTDMFEVSYSHWQEIYNWGTQNGYSFTNPGLNADPNGISQTGDHPVHSISWHDAVKWANARSEKEGFAPSYFTDANCTVVYRSGELDVDNFKVDWTASGYRLPTEAEWEVAARGGLAANDYAWGNSPFPSKANYLDSGLGKTAPAGSFPANGYGIHEVGGNLREWVWDWEDNRTVVYDFKLTFPDANGSYSLVNDLNSTAVFFAVPTDENNNSYSAFGPIAEDNSTISIARGTRGPLIEKTFNFAPAAVVLQVKNELWNRYSGAEYYTYCDMRFFYSDGSTETVRQRSSAIGGMGATPLEVYYLNPSPHLTVTKIEVEVAQNTNWDGAGIRERNTVVLGAYSDSASPYLTIDLPQYRETNATHFKVKVDEVRGGDDDVWFELVDESNSTMTYANADFDQLLPMSASISQPRQLRVYMKPATTGATSGGTAVRAVYWTTTDPKGLWSGSKRVHKDGAYGDTLRMLQWRDESSPNTISPLIGFRLVRRPSEN